MSAIDVLQAILTACATIAAAIASVYAYRLHKLQIHFEEKTKSIQNRQVQILNEMSEFSTAIINQTLKVSPQFATMPYQQLLPSISPSDMSQFDRRRSHFAPEKELLANVVVRRMADQIDKDKDLVIILILDAGSTVYPIFRQLCVHSSFQFDRTKASRLKMITNNLPGVSDLIRYGRIGNPVMAGTLFQCRILSGFAHSQYDASLSNETSKDLYKAIDEFKEINKQPEKIKIVSVTTGNYISITEGVLGRDQNHLETKSAMLGVADEIYVLAPLGKLLPYSCQEINDLLGIDNEARYSSLPKWPERSHDLNMVITTRPPEYFPNLHPLILNSFFARIQGEASDHYRKHLMTIPFDPMDDMRVRVIASITGVERALREYELPHQNLRDKLIAKLQSH